MGKADRLLQSQIQEMPNNSLWNIHRELVDNERAHQRTPPIYDSNPGGDVYINFRAQLSGDTISQNEGTTYHLYPPNQFRHELKEWPRNGGGSHASHQITEDDIKLLLAIPSQ